MSQRNAFVKTYHAIDSALDLGIEALHAEASAVDAAKTKRLGHRLREGARVDLDGYFGIGQHGIGVAECAGEIGKGLRRAMIVGVPSPKWI